ETAQAGKWLGAADRWSEAAGFPSLRAPLRLSAGFTRTSYYLAATRDGCGTQWLRHAMAATRATRPSGRRMSMGAQSAGEYDDRSDHGRDRWQRRYAASRLRDADFTTLSGLPVDPVYGPPQGSVVPGFERIGWPGEFPFTRGLYPAGYRGR